MALRPFRILPSLVLCGGFLVAQVPSSIPFQGRLAHQSSGPVQGNVKMQFRIYASPFGGTALWTETHGVVAVNQGMFKVELGSIRAIPDDVLNGRILYVGLSVGNDWRWCRDCRSRLRPTLGSPVTSEAIFAPSPCRSVRVR